MKRTSPLLQVGEQAGQVALALERRAGGGAHADAQLVGDDAGERRLAEAGRAGEQHVVERLAAVLAAWTKIASCSLTARWPTNSSKCAAAARARAHVRRRARSGSPMRCRHRRLMRGSPPVQREAHELLDRRPRARRASAVLGLAH